MRKDSRLAIASFLIILILAGCTTVPDPRLERSLPSGNGTVRAAGSFTYRYSYGSSLLPSWHSSGWPEREGALLQSSNYYRLQHGFAGMGEALRGNNRSLLSRSVLVEDGKSARMSFEMRYEIGYPGERLVPRELPDGIELEIVDFGQLSHAMALPFVAMTGTWLGRPVKVYCSRDVSPSEDGFFLGALLIDIFPSLGSKPGMAKYGSDAFTAFSQKFQVVDGDDRLLAELQRGAFRIFDSVSEDNIASMKSLLGTITEAFWFTRFVDGYRRNSAKEEDSQDLASASE